MDVTVCDMKKRMQAHRVNTVSVFCFCDFVTDKSRIIWYNKDTIQNRKEVSDMSVLKISAANFNEILRSEKPVLLDFYAEWCGPCRMVSPLVDEIAAEHPEFTVGKINVDEQPDLAAAFGVSSIPMLAVMKGGKVVSRAVGARPKADILDMLQR